MSNYIIALLLTLGIIAGVSSCSVLETKVDEKIAPLMVKWEKEFCSHSKEHRDLLVEEWNERLPNSSVTWECKGNE